MALAQFRDLYPFLFNLQDQIRSHGFGTVPILIGEVIMLRSRMLRFALSVGLCAASPLSVAQTEDGFFSRAYPRIEGGSENGALLTGTVMAGEALWSYLALMLHNIGLGSIRGEIGSTSFQFDSTALMSAHRALTSESERQLRINDLMSDSRSFRYDFKAKEFVLTIEAQTALNDLKSAPIISAGAKADMIRTAEINWNRSNEELVNRLNSKGFKFKKFFVVGGQIASVDLVAQIILIITTDHVGKVSPLMAIPVQAAQDLADALSSRK